MATKNRENAQRGPEDQGKRDAGGHQDAARDADLDTDAVGPAGATEATAAGAPAEPELSVTAEDLTLAEPVLAPASVSKTTADAAALEDAAAEAQAVADEAEDAGTLLAGPLPANAPTVTAAPSGTAPAGGPAGDVADPTLQSSEAQGGSPRSGASAAGGSTGSSIPDGRGGETPSGDAPPAGPAGEQPAPNSSAGSTSGRSAGDPSAPNATADGSAEDAGTGGPDASAADDTEDLRLASVLETVAVGSGAAHSGLLAGTDPAALGVGPAASSGATGRAGATAVSRSASGGPETAEPSAEARRSVWAPAGDAGDPVGPRRARSRERREKSRRPVAILVLGGVAVLALVVWAAISLVRGLTGAGDPQSPEDIPTAAGADGVIAEDVPPSVLTAGHCLLDFTDIESDVTIVTCSTPHRAQLIASEFYPDDAKFPGRDQLGARADAACETAPIDSGVAAGAGRIELLRVTPTEGTWADGDRRVDCFAVLQDGATLSRSLLTE
ncbi:septum formation family protein [Arthrobacter sp. MSA 4-2]|uniref:septum formation family protein n=1 Tax=Arthrobacter sp. MSA 4-2 TaxID=2794349 RepID=UPI0018E74FC4|nr:septum formation family protein [Arthrobacter sp. MSA 4-2]MBJ2120224.1 septum formation family protein [Arthrobacter sp. MSA 4-2]